MSKALLALIQQADEETLRQALIDIIEKVEELDSDDFFGTEGLIHFLGWD